MHKDSCWAVRGSRSGGCQPEVWFVANCSRTFYSDTHPLTVIRPWFVRYIGHWGRKGGAKVYVIFAILTRNRTKPTTVSAYTSAVKRTKRKPLRAERGLGQAQHRYKDREMWLGVRWRSGLRKRIGPWDGAVNRLDGNVIYCKSALFWDSIYFMKSMITAMVYHKGYREQGKWSRADVQQGCIVSLF